MNKVLKVRNHLIPDFWVEGEPASNHTGCFTTDGTKLYSYELLIGDTCTSTGAKVLRDYTAPGRHGFRSMTTSKHVGLSRAAADIID